MAFFSLLWKAKTIEKYRLDYENEKIKSILSSDMKLPKNNFMQKYRHFRHDTKKQMQKKFRQWCPEGSAVSNFLLYVRMDQTFPNFLLKSLLGFVGGIIMTYLCFMFFVFQLSISLMHATLMSSVIGILLTLGLAFSYRIRCLVFLLIPQFFSRVGRYTLTCYALVLILTGPATNTLKNSEVLSESMACGQEQIKASVRQLNDSYKNSLNLVKDSIKTMVEKIKETTSRFKQMLLRINRLILSLASILQSMISWLLSLVPVCNSKFGSPYQRCIRAINKGYADYAKSSTKPRKKYDSQQLAELVCWTVKPYDAICIPQDYVNRNIAAVVRGRLKNFSSHIKAMLEFEVHIHQSHSFNNNVSNTASQAAAGIVTEIRNRADPMLTWLSWSSCVTSLFLLLIIFRAKYYQHMFETRSRFDNRYLTKELRALDFKRYRQGKETILPLNRRERMKYICATSYQLVPSEKVYLSRSAVFMTITTFKLLIHIVADYSLYWILMTIRHHGRFQTPMSPGYPDAGVRVSGSGPIADFMKSIIDAMYIPLNTPSPMPLACLPDPIPPDMHRYMQIGVLIILLWFFALFEPYGLRLRHVIMSMYNPDRAKARATWLYNHILTTRAGFMKYARRKLHRQYKYSSEKKLTFKCLLNSYLPLRWLQVLFGGGLDKPQCLLCSTREIPKNRDTELIFCETKSCPGVFCVSCFGDIGQLCTICLSPAEYGDVSDISLELGSSDDSEDNEQFDCNDSDSNDENNQLLRRTQTQQKPSRSNNNDVGQMKIMSKINEGMVKSCLNRRSINRNINHKPSRKA